MANDSDRHAIVPVVPLEKLSDGEPNVKIHQLLHESYSPVVNKFFHWQPVLQLLCVECYP